MILQTCGLLLLWYKLCSCSEDGDMFYMTSQTQQVPTTRNMWETSAKNPQPYKNVLLDLVNEEISRRKQSSRTQNIISRIVTSEIGNTYTQQPTNYRIAPRLQSPVLQSDPQKDTKLDSQYKDMESSLKELLQIFNYLNGGYHYDPYKRIKHPKGGQLRSKLFTEDQIAPLRDTSNSQLSADKRESGSSGLFTYWKAGIQNQNQQNPRPQWREI